MPRPRRFGFICVMSRPLSVMRPRVVSMKPAIICSVVVLPQPDGPSSETNSPFSTDRLMPVTACRSPNVFDTSVNVRNDMVWPFGARHRLYRRVSVEPTLASQIPERQRQIPINDIKIYFLPLNGIHLLRLRVVVPLCVPGESTESHCAHGSQRSIADMFVFQREHQLVFRSMES
ncbi:hypothetical protein PSAB6_250118 [Paraburkholderia sabiae]|nr:hypothetical protein PSAB6_250118 [Paraburkholderia sabiae]